MIGELFKRVVHTGILIQEFLRGSQGERETGFFPGDETVDIATELI
jgi:hypothetical protein